jgi:hypothetical protein
MRTVESGSSGSSGRSGHQDLAVQDHRIQWIISAGTSGSSGISPSVDPLTELVITGTQDSANKIYTIITT